MKRFFVKTIDETVDEVASTVRSVERGVYESTRPVRRKVLSRFPILFALLTTFGVASIFFAFERIITEINFLYERPWLILFVGVFILVFTGSLYKNLNKRL